MLGCSYDDDFLCLPAPLIQAFLIIFIINLIIVIALAGVYGKEALEKQSSSDSESSDGMSNTHVINTVCILALAAAVFSGLWLTVMIRKAENLIRLVRRGVGGVVAMLYT